MRTAGIRTKEAAARLGIAPSTLRRLERDRMIPPPSRDWTGGRRYTEADLAALKARLFRAPPERAGQGAETETPGG